MRTENPRVGSSILSLATFNTQIFIVLELEQFLQGLDLWDSIQAELLEMVGQRIDQAALVAVELAQPSWILPGFRVVLDDVIYGTVEDHEPGRVTGDNFG